MMNNIDCRDCIDDLITCVYSFLRVFSWGLSGLFTQSFYVITSHGLFFSSSLSLVRAYLGE